jgi:hypothetical protein
VKIRFKRVVLRVAAATGLLAGSSVVACSGTTDPGTSPGPSGGGTTSVSGATATGGTGGTTAGGGMSSSGGGAKCPGNQIGTPGACMCPAYAPTFCEAIPKCVSPMKDPEHCGDCATACGPMQACAAGKCTADLATVAEITGCGTLQLVSAPGKLYVLSTMTGTLSSIALPAGGMPTDVATGLTGATAFAIDAMNAYVVAGMTVTQVKLADGTKTVLVTETAQIFDVAVSNGKIYYGVGEEVKQASATAAGTGTSVAIGIDHGLPQGVAVSGDSVLYASASAFNVESDPIVGEGHVKIGASQADLVFGHRSVQVDAMNVFWANGGVQKALFTGADHAAKTVAVPFGGQGAKTIAYAADPAAKTVYIATDDGNFAKSTYSDDKDTEEAAWVARALPKVSSIVLDDASVYIASACKILKSAR